jgi:predicted acyltransferase
VALLAMGMFTVNTEYGEATIGKPLFTIIMLLGFFLIWNLYPKTEDKKKQNFYSILKVIGVIILVVLAFIYRDPNGDIFQPRWWGILGLIGWTYLLCAIIYLYLNKRRIYLFIALVLFILLCIAGSNHWLGSFDGIIPGNGCFHAFTMCGMLISLLFNQSKSDLSINKKMMIATSAGIVFFIAAFVSHYFWIISKIQATPTWLFICTSISILFYVFMYWIADMKGKASWFDIIKPAGTATLTCYLIPYLLYSIFILTSFTLPEAITASPVGLVKCIVFAFVTIGITALLGKVGVKLKI